MAQPRPTLALGVMDLADHLLQPVHTADRTQWVSLVVVPGRIV
jgi:hypothetical protein